MRHNAGETQGPTCGGRSPKAIWPAVVAGIAGLVLVVAAALLWYPPSRQTGFAPLSSQPFLAEANGRVNVNTATVEELCVLPGVGEKKAQAIVAYREENGPFSAVEELEAVSGIGPKIIEGLRDYVSF